MSRRQALTIALATAAVTLGAWQRARAVRELPADFDELTYLPAAYRYAERMTSGWVCKAAQRSAWASSSSSIVAKWRFSTIRK